MDIKEKIEEKKVFNEEDVLHLMENYNGSLRDLKRVIKWMRNKFGKKAFTPYLEQRILEFMNKLDH